jgi:hypothetical protein
MIRRIVEMKPCNYEDLALETSSEILCLAKKNGHHTDPKIKPNQTEE